MVVVSLLDADTLHAVLDVDPDRLYVLDLRGRYCFFNAAVRRRADPAGLDRLLGRSPADGLPPELARPVERMLDAALHGLPQTRPRPLPAPDAGRRSFATSAVPLRGGDGSIVGVLVRARDVTTEALRAEQLRREAELQRRVAAIARASATGVPTAVILADVADAARVLVGDGAAAVLRRVRAELVAAAVAGDGLRIVPGDRRRHADAPAVRDAVARRRAVVRSVPPGLRTREDLDVAAAAPIRTGGRIWGALVAWPDARPGRETSLLSSLQQLADIAGLALDVASSRRRLAALALTDGLTGLPNARAVGDRLAEEVAHARRHGHALVLAEIDLDRFKLINDVHGHAAGDAVLRAVGAVLRQTARAGDVVGRVGGEEFVWVMRETGLADGVAAADRLRSRIAACGPTGAAAVTASIGIAALGPDDDARSLLAGADLAVYQAKADGRDVTRVCAVTGGVLDPAARSALVEHDRIVEGLRALARRRAGGPTLPSRWAARAGRAARAAGWSERDVRRLQDAAALTGVEPGLTSVVLDSEQTSWLAGRGHGGALLTAARAPEQEQAAA